jgi:alpha-N-arabinofuranosidase
LILTGCGGGTDGSDASTASSGNSAAGSDLTARADPPASANLTASISFNLADVGTPSNRALLGNNIQWTNNGDGLVTSLGVPRPAVVNAVIPTGPSVLRYPGGSLTDTYRWRDGVGAIATRGFNLDLENKSKQVIFGTDEFLKLAATLSAIPLLTVNVVTGSAQEAADWVKYVNVPGGAPRVRFWEIGNEPYLIESLRPELALTPPEFARRADLAITAMKAADPTIKVGLPLRSDKLGNIPATRYVDYNKTVLSSVRNRIDFVTVHNAYLPFYYADADADVPVSDQDLYTAAMTASNVVTADLNATAAQVRALRPEGALPMAVSEYNALFGLSTPALIQKGSSLAGALYVADILQVMANRNDILFANFWSLSGNGNFGVVDESGSPRPAYYVLQSYNRLLQGQVLPASITAPTLSSPAVGVVPAGTSPLVSAVVTRLNKMLRVVIINKHATANVDLAMNLANGQAAGGSTYSRLAGADLFSGAQGYSAISWTSGAVAGSGAQLKFNLPPHSFTLFEIPLL